MPCNSKRTAGRFAAGLAGVCLALSALAAAPPKPAPAKSPEALQGEQLTQGLDDFESDMLAVNDSLTKFTVTFGEIKPEQAAAQEQAAKDRIAIASAAIAEARNLQAQASAIEKTLPAVARNLRLAAIDKVSAARSKLGEARDIYDPPKPPTTPVPQAQLGDRCMSACQQLKRLQSKGTEQGGDKEEFEGARQPLTPFPYTPAPDRILRGSFQQPPRLAPDGASLILPQGDNLGLQNLRDAVADVAPAVAAKPLFTQCGDRTCPSRDLLRLLDDKDRREELRRIGGVSLDVTFDLLATSGMSELRSGMQITMVDKPVLVSLRALAEAAEPWRSDWDNLPQDLRYPGHLGRIRGIVLAADGDDAFLVGNRAETSAALIDIDTISITLRTVWREGKAPAVSLDPRPDEIGGAQYPRIIQLPAGSVVASIMLDADYAMKAINLGSGWAQPLDLIGFNGIVSRHEAEFDSPGGSLSRYWLTPRPMGPEQFYRSVTGRTLLFETAVQAQTEAMFTQNGQIQGTATAGQVAQEIATAFTQAYPALERDARVQPLAIFARLHGVIDVATLAQTMRSLQIAPAVFDRIAGLPYRRLRGREAVPPSYPGLSSRHELAAGVLLTSGGAQLAVRQRAASSRGYSDHIGGGLEAAVDGWRGGIANAISASFALPPGAESNFASDDDTTLLAASRALEREDWDAASSSFERYASRQPEEASGYHGLALALIGKGRLREALRPAARALLLAPGDPATEMLIHDIAWQLDGVESLSVLSPEERMALSFRYTQIALAAFGQGKRERADHHAIWALQLDPDNGDVHLLRAFLAPAQSQARELAVSLAIRSFRRRAKAGDTAAGLDVAIGLHVAATHHFQRGLMELQGQRTLTSNLFMQSALSEAREAELANPDLAEATALRLVISAYMDWLQNPEADVSPGLHNEAARLTERFPQLAMAHSARSQLFALGLRWQEAMLHLQKAIALAPNDPSLHAIRSRLQAALGNCVEAESDYAQARQMAGTRVADYGLDRPPVCPIPRG